MLARFRFGADLNSDGLTSPRLQSTQNTPTFIFAVLTALSIALETSPSQRVFAPLLPVAGSCIALKTAYERLLDRDIASLTIPLHKIVLDKLIEVNTGFQHLLVPLYKRLHVVTAQGPSKHHLAAYSGGPGTIAPRNQSGRRPLSVLSTAANTNTQRLYLLFFMGQP